MTILTKPSSVINKPGNQCLKLEGNQYLEEKIEVHPSTELWVPSKRSSGAMLCLSILALLLMMTGVITGLGLYRQYLKSNGLHYQGFCSIPIRSKMDPFILEPKYRKMPLQWSVEPQNLEIVSTVNEDESDDFVNTLREELEIGDSVEKIVVLHDGHLINFIHDFSSNTTGIVDQDRCFISDLDRELVLNPDVFSLSIQQGEEFDITRMRSILRAVLPAIKFLQASQTINDLCINKPTYKLVKDEQAIIRKRSIEDPKPDFMQFSGKHVQEIEINNLAEILEYEKKNNIA